MRIAVSFFLLFLACSCNSQEKQLVQLVDNQELMTLLEKSELQLVDVRTPEEVSQGMIAGAKNINFHDSQFERKISALDKEKPIAVYCGMGVRSGKAGDLLYSLGFQEIYDLTGGFTQWQQADFPVALPE